jgi:predicted HTH transcriptional regulator
MPKIDSVDGGVKVTFQRNNVSNSQKTILNGPKDGPKDDPKEISERQMLMLKEMDVNDTITIQEMTQKMKVSEKTIKREIALLQGMGALVREGGRKEGRWVVLMKL